MLGASEVEDVGNTFSIVERVVAEEVFYERVKLAELSG